MARAQQNGWILPALVVTGAAVLASGARAGKIGGGSEKTYYLKKGERWELVYQVSRHLTPAEVAGIETGLRYAGAEKTTWIYWGGLQGIETVRVIQKDEALIVPWEKTVDLNGSPVTEKLISARML